MKPTNEPSRRQFLAASSSLVLAGSVAALDEKNTTPDSRLALQGGTKAVAEPMPKLVRWGEPERERLRAAERQHASERNNEARQRAPGKSARHGAVSPCSMVDT